MEEERKKILYLTDKCDGFVKIASFLDCDTGLSTAANFYKHFSLWQTLKFLIELVKSHNCGLEME